MLDVLNFILTLFVTVGMSYLITKYRWPFGTALSDSSRMSQTALTKDLLVIGKQKKNDKRTLIEKLDEIFDYKH